MKMTTRHLLFLLLPVLTLIGCEDDDDSRLQPQVEEPTTFTFERGGESTVSFSGQTTRVGMSAELVAGMKDPAVSAATLRGRFANEGDAFATAEYNASSKSIRSKVAASRDRYATNTVDQAAVRADFAGWLDAQVTEVHPNRDVLATAGTAGQIQDGSKARYVNAGGLEYDQAVAKGLIGALMLDQIVSNYLSPAVLDEASNRADNDAGTTAEGKPYTTMEHKWDEAYGYLFPNPANTATPLATLGSDDDFLNKYLGRVNADPEYAGIAERVFAAYKRGRAAIVAGNYEVRDEQAQIIRGELSRVIAIRSVYYLDQAITGLNAEPISYGGLFHDLSEAYGFIYSLQFTADPAAGGSAYFTRDEVTDLLSDIYDPADNGFWTVTTAELAAVRDRIAAKL